MLEPSKTWFVIINPTSGNGKSKKKWPKIERLLELYHFDFKYAFTEYSKHSVVLVQKAISNGFTNIICVGGDGTIHNIVNGILSQSMVPSNTINVAMIPIGTGNDWVKTHRIPMDIETAITTIVKGNSAQQDVGKIEFENPKKPPVYFNNLAGVGFDGHVVSKVHKYKYLGTIAYLCGAIIGLFTFKNFSSNVHVNSTAYSGKTLMVLVGLCTYSGGGMKLTKGPNPNDGFFDISIAKDFSKLEVLKNLGKLFNGTIVNHKKVVCLKANSLEILINQTQCPFIQTDGELIGTGNIKISLIPKAFSFYC